MKRYIKSAITPVEKEDYETKLSLAKDPSTGIDLLTMLYHSTPKGNYELLGAILDRTDIPVDWLIESARNKDSLHALSNPKMPIEYLKKYSHSDNYFERMAVAENPATPASILAEMASMHFDYNDKFVLRKIAENPNTPLSTIEELSKFDDEWIRINALRNPNATEEMHSIFKEEFHKESCLSIDISGDAVPAQIDMDNILKDICARYGIEFYGSYCENITQLYEDCGFPYTGNTVFQYNATMEFIFNKKLRSTITIEFDNALSNPDCYVECWEWSTADN